jgi:hypothetical protein
MITVRINNRYYSIPREWNELTASQLVDCLDVIYGSWSADKKQLALVRILSGISRWRFQLADVDELAEYFYLLEFLFTSNTLTKNLFPAYGPFYGPGNNFNNVIVSEYIFSESHYQLYKEHGDQADLDMLIAVLYRPGKSVLKYNYSINPDGDYRIKFNDNLIEYHARRIRHWPASIKNAILHYYEGCRGQLVACYEDVFGGSGDPAKRGMLSLVVSMAETNTFGSFEHVEKLLLHTFMIGMSEAVDKSNKAFKK